MLLESGFEKISDYWRAPPNPSYLHIIVEPPPGERCVHWVSEISLTVSRQPHLFLPTPYAVSPLLYFKPISCFIPQSILSTVPRCWSICECPLARRATTVTSMLTRVW